MQRRNVSPVSLTTRIKSLRNRHREISVRIENEQTRPMPDSQRLSQLKRERLRLKDAIRGASSLMFHSSSPPHSAA
jgi:hypothetical protein